MEQVTRTMSRRTVLIVGALLATTVAVVAYALGAFVDPVTVDALKKAGLVANGGAISGVSGFFSALTANLIWIAVTVIGASVVAIGLLFILGHSRAQDYAIKVALGALVIVGAPGIMA